MKRNLARTATHRPVAATTKRYIPHYYLCEPLQTQEGESADILDLCESMGFDVQSYLVVETMAKLRRYRSKGTPVQDIDKAIEQLYRLRALVLVELGEDPDQVAADEVAEAAAVEVDADPGDLSEVAGYAGARQ